MRSAACLALSLALLASCGDKASAPPPKVAVPAPVKAPAPSQAESPKLVEAPPAPKRALRDRLDRLTVSAHPLALEGRPHQPPFAEMPRAVE